MTCVLTRTNEWTGIALSWHERVKSASDSLFRWRAARRAAEMPVVAVILVEIYLKLIKITPETSEIFIILPK